MTRVVTWRSGTSSKAARAPEGGLDLAIQRGADCLLVSRPEGDGCRLPAYLPAVGKGVQHMVVEIGDEACVTAAFEDLRPGDGEAFWT